MIHINGRFQTQNITGVQRYASEIARRLTNARMLTAPAWAVGIKGHFWEQAVLSRTLKSDHLLWSPCNIGPLSVSNQIVTIHDMAFIDQPDGFSKSFRILYQTLIPRLARRCRHILTVSEFSKSRIVELTSVPPEKISVVYNGVDRFLPSDDSDVTALREKLKISGHFFSTVGTLEPRKNLRRLFKAWKIVEQKHSGIKLVVVGSRNKVFRQETFDDIPGSILFSGRLEDHELQALYTGSVGFIYPSVYEGFGLPPLEAMACGCPTACSTGTSLEEVTGTSALHFDPLNHEDIADKVLQIFENPELQLKLRNKGKIQAAIYRWDDSAAMIQSILQKYSVR